MERARRTERGRLRSSCGAKKLPHEPLTPQGLSTPVLNPVYRVFSPISALPQTRYPTHPATPPHFRSPFSSSLATSSLPPLSQAASKPVQQQPTRPLFDSLYLAAAALSNLALLPIFRLCSLASLIAHVLPPLISSSPKANGRKEETHSANVLTESSKVERISSSSSSATADEAPGSAASMKAAISPK